MKRYKKISIMTLIVFLIANIINVPLIKDVQALDDVKLVSTCRVTKEEAQNWARSKGATETFISLADLYWKYSASHGNINPSIAYVQAAKETGYGKFGGVITEEYHNPCGMKTTAGGDDKDPNAHMKYATWDEGVQAHLDHMALYAGVAGYPREDTYDPRHFSYLFGTGGDSIITMGTKWATSSTYGETLLALYYDLLSYKVPKMWVEDTNVTYSGSSRYLNIRGWAVNASEVKSVQIYADNKLIGNAQIGLSRPDVKKAYPTYVGAENAGFTAEIDITKAITASNSSIKVVATGNDGTTTTSTKNVTIEKPAPKMWVENTNVTYSGSSRYLNVGGWAINATEVESVKVYADDKLLGNAEIGLSRPDVRKVYPQYTGAENAGFTAKFDITKAVTSTKSTIKVIAFGTDGTTTTSTNTISIEKPAPKMWVEDTNISYSGSSRYLNVRGWGINATEVKSVQIYADNKLIGSAQIGLSRPDVQKAYPQYAGAENAGFTAKIDVTKAITASTATIKVVATGNDGVTTSSSKTISIEKPAPKMWVENVNVSNESDITYLNVGGWAVNATEVKSVQVYVDNNLIGSAQTGLSRPDVQKAYPQYAGAENAGFTAKLDITKSVTSGTRTVKVVATGNDGVTTSISKIVTITVKQKLIVIDPGHLGHDSGAVANGYKESDLNAAVAVKLEKALSDMGYNTYMTRSPLRPNEFTYLSTTDELKQRYNVANDLKADLFISLHHDSGSSTSTGIWTFYSSWKPELKDVAADKVALTTGFDGWADTKPTQASITSKEFGQKVLNNLTSKCNYPAVRTSTVDRNLSVTVHTKMPSILIELGFLTNKTEVARCASSTDQQNKANAIAETVKSMF